MALAVFLKAAPELVKKQMVLFFLEEVQIGPPSPAMTSLISLSPLLSPRTVRKSQKMAL